MAARWKSMKKRENGIDATRYEVLAVARACFHCDCRAE